MTGARVRPMYGIAGFAWHDIVVNPVPTAHQNGEGMGPELIAVETDPAPPARADVVIIGGGIAGVSTLLSLAERGVSAVLVEKGRLAGEQSSRNWGFCRTQGRADLAEVPLAVESLRQWDRMAERIGAEVGFTRAGACYLCETPREVADYEAWLDGARQWQVRSRVIGSDEVDTLVPGSSRRWAGALYTDNDGRAEPQLAVPLMARAARRLGCLIVTGCAARGFETTAGRLSGVVTERGTIECDAAVLAGGAWSRLFCGQHVSIDFPQLKILGSVMRTERLTSCCRSWLGRWSGFRVSQNAGMVVTRSLAATCMRRFWCRTVFAFCRNSLARRSGSVRNIGCGWLAAFVRRHGFLAVGRWTKPARSRRPAFWTPPLIRRSWRKDGGTSCVLSRPSRRRAASRSPGAG